MIKSTFHICKKENKCAMYITVGEILVFKKFMTIITGIFIKKSNFVDTRNFDFIRTRIYMF